MSASLPVLGVLQKFTKNSVVLLPDGTVNSVVIPQGAVHITRITAYTDIPKVHQYLKPEVLSADEKADTMMTEVIAWVDPTIAADLGLSSMGPPL